MQAKLHTIAARKTQWSINMRTVTLVITAKPVSLQPAILTNKQQSQSGAKPGKAKTSEHQAESTQAIGSLSWNSLSCVHVNHPLTLDPLFLKSCEVDFSSS